MSSERSCIFCYFDVPPLATDNTRHVQLLISHGFDKTFNHTYLGARFDEVFDQLSQTCIQQSRSFITHEENGWLYFWHYDFMSEFGHRWMMWCLDTLRKSTDFPFSASGYFNVVQKINKPCSRF